MTEFKLSEKIRSELYGEYNSVIDDTEFHPEDSLKVKDVKKFIILLKERLKYLVPDNEEIGIMVQESIDKLAGERLK
jgi:hypothetical protein